GIRSRAGFSAMLANMPRSCASIAPGMPTGRPGRCGGSRSGSLDSVEIVTFRGFSQGFTDNFSGRAGQETPVPHGVRPALADFFREFFDFHGKTTSQKKISA